MNVSVICIELAVSWKFLNSIQDCRLGCYLAGGLTPNQCMNRQLIRSFLDALYMSWGGKIILLIPELRIIQYCTVLSRALGDQSFSNSL